MGKRKPRASMTACLICAFSIGLSPAVASPDFANPGTKTELDLNKLVREQNERQREIQHQLELLRNNFHNDTRDSSRTRTLAPNISPRSLSGTGLNYNFLNPHQFRNNFSAPTRVIQPVQNGNRLGPTNAAQQNPAKRVPDPVDANQKSLVKNNKVPANAGGKTGPKAQVQTDPVSAQKPEYIFDGKLLTPQQYEALQLSTDVKYIANCNWQAADAQLQKAIALYPDLYLAHSNRAFVLKKLSRLDEALAEAIKSRQLAPKVAEPIFMIASIEQSSGNIDKALEQYQFAVKQFPNHPLAGVTRALIERLKLESAKQHAIAKRLSTDSKQDDYFEYVTYESITKWAPDKFPLKIFLPSEKQAARLPGYKTEYGAALRDALNEWRDASKDTVSFELVAKSQAADIECQWTNNPLALCNPAEAGETRSRIDLGKGMLHAKIMLLTVAPGMPSVPVKDIKRTALHELGHSFGLMGHSPQADDLMFCSVSDRQGSLTDRDLKTLKHLYQPDVKLAHEYHESGLAGNSIAFNDDGAQLLSEKNFEKASEKFIEALKINPDCEPAKQNLAVCQKNMALNNIEKGDLPVAVTQLKMALGLAGDDGDIQEKTSILSNLADAYTKLNDTSEAEKCSAAASKLAEESADSDSKPSSRSTAADTTSSATQAICQSQTKGPGAAGSGGATARSQMGKYGVVFAGPTGSGTEAYLLFNQPVSRQSPNSFHLGIEKKEAAQPDVDFGPYMADLQRRIKRNWFPPKGNESKKVVVQFKIHRGGNISGLQTITSSGLAIADKAALKAVENAAPVRPLPDGAPEDVDIQFTFDYNVFSGGSHNTFYPSSNSDSMPLIQRWLSTVQKMPTPDNLVGLGCAYEQAGQLDEAEKQFHKALDLDPSCKMAKDHLSSVLEAKTKPKVP